MATKSNANKFRNAQFLSSAAQLSQCPEDSGLEVAFAGRSNAGKSSAINTLTDNKKLARTSKTPGRTRLLNFFGLANESRLVDLPGYGYAKVSAAMKRDWQKHLTDYLWKRESLQGLVLVMDIRHPLQAFDVNMLDWCSESQLPVHVLLTKSDKLKRGKAKESLFHVQKALEKYQTAMTVQQFSSLNGEGLDELINRLNKWLDAQNSIQ